MASQWTTPTRVNSWAPQVIADSSGQWTGNALRFPTDAEAEDYVADLFRRWALVESTRVIPSPDWPTHRWVDGRVVKILTGAITLAHRCRECGADETVEVYNPECSTCESRKVEDFAARGQW